MGRTIQRLIAVLSGLSACLAACSPTAPPPPPPTEGPPPQGLVIAPDALSAEAGLAMLRQGGSAADAAAAMFAVASLTRPDAASLAGGGVMLHYDAVTAEIIAYDGLSAAPAELGETARTLLSASSSVAERQTSGLLIGAPGAVDLLALAHRDHGLLPWAVVFEPAIALAEQGVPISPELAQAIAAHASKLAVRGDTRARFLSADGAPRQAGERMKDRALLRTLRDIAANADAPYHGRVANAIIASVQASPGRGELTGRDLAGYRARRGRALCVSLSENTACGPRPPAEGGLYAGQMLSMLHRRGFDVGGARDIDNWVLLLEAQRLAHADAERFLGDEAVAALPLDGLLAPQYLTARADALDPHGRASPPPEAGDPWAFETTGAAGPDISGVAQSVTLNRGEVDAAASMIAPFAGIEILAIDAAGDAAALSATLGSPFGSARLGAGLLLNDVLTHQATSAMRPAARADGVTGLVRPRAPLAPLIIIGAEGELVLATAAAGDGAAPAAAVSALSVLYWGRRAGQAVGAPVITLHGDQARLPLDHERSEGLAVGLRARGFDMRVAGRRNAAPLIVREADGTLRGAIAPQTGIVAAP